MIKKTHLIAAVIVISAIVSGYMFFSSQSELKGKENLSQTNKAKPDTKTTKQVTSSTTASTTPIKSTVKTTTSTTRTPAKRTTVRHGPPSKRF